MPLSGVAVSLFREPETKTPMNSLRLLGAALLAAAAVIPSVHAAPLFATEVVSYIPGTGVSDGLTMNPGAALGGPSPGVSVGTPFEGIYTPFNPPFEGSALVQIGVGGSITLRLSNFVTIDRTPGVFEIGVWENVGFADANFPNETKTGPTTGPGFGFGSDYARVEVSADGVTWYSLNNGNRILFDLAGNYFANATNSTTPPPNPQVGDFGQPFAYPDSPYLPSRESLTDKTLGQLLTAFNGSGGGNWLNLDSVPVDEVGFIRFSDPLLGPDGSFVPNDNTFELDFVAINTVLAGAPTPEPTSAALLLVGLALGGTLRQRRG